MTAAPDRSRQGPGRAATRGVADGTIASLLRIAEASLYGERSAKSAGFLQRLDPRVKVIGIFSLIVSVTVARRIEVIAALFAIAVALAASSRLSLGRMLSRVWLAALPFTGAIALPACFITPGVVAFRLPLLGWAATHQGLTSAAFLIGRVEAAVTLSAMLVLSTPWAHVLKSLRMLGVPVLLVVMLGMTYRFVFVMLESAHDMFESRRSRLVGRLGARQRRRVMAAAVGVLLHKSIHLSNEVYLAMISRGFRGGVYTIDEFRTAPRDWAALAGFLAIACLACWRGIR